MSPKDVVPETDTSYVVVLSDQEDMIFYICVSFGHQIVYTGVEELASWWQISNPVIHFYLVDVNKCTEALGYWNQ